MRQCLDLIEGLRYKLRMMGIPLEGPTSIFCDNQSVVNCTVAPESTLKKKNCSIAWHRTREAQAAGYVRIAWIEGTSNVADAFTKVLTGKTRSDLLRRILW